MRLYYGGLCLLAEFRLGFHSWNCTYVVYQEISVKKTSRQAWFICQSRSVQIQWFKLLELNLLRWKHNVLYILCCMCYISSKRKQFNSRENAKKDWYAGFTREIKNISFVEIRNVIRNAFIHANEIPWTTERERERVAVHAYASARKSFHFNLSHVKISSVIQIIMRMR